MLFVPYLYSRPGMTVLPDGSINALLWSPFSKRVDVLPDKGAPIALEPAEGGYWKGHGLSLNIGDAYQIRLNGQKAFPDPASLSQPLGVHGSSQVTNLDDFQWSDTEWRTPDQKDLIIYELHVGVFSQSADFKGVEERLDGLVELGVTAIELMPVGQFPGSRNWGYDGVFPYAVQFSYGGAKGLQNLVDTCHQKGLAVILDVVYNHLGPEGNYLGQYGPYFTDKYQTPWGAAINFDDSWCDGVRHYFIQNALMWMRDFHIDGLRLDAVHAMKDFGAVHFLAQLKQEVEVLNRETGQKHILIAECDLNDVKYLNPLNLGGYEMDGQWCDEFHHALHSQVTGEINGYYSDFGGMDPLVKTLKDAFVYDGVWSSHRQKIFGSKTTGLERSRFVVFSQNHDQIGNRMLGDRLSTLLDFETLKLVAGFTLLSPYTPMLFMGEEYGEKHPFLYFTSHSDPLLVEAVRSGRKNEFKDFIEDQEPPDPQAPETFEKCMLTHRDHWSHEQHVLSVFHRKLIHLRKTTPIFEFRMEVITEAPKVISVSFSTGQQRLLIIYNFGDTSFLKKLTFGKYDLLLHSADQEWLGNGEEPLKASHEAPELSLSGRSFLVLMQKFDLAENTAGRTQ